MQTMEADKFCHTEQYLCTWQRNNRWHVYGIFKQAFSFHCNFSTKIWYLL